MSTDRIDRSTVERWLIIISDWSFTKSSPRSRAILSPGPTLLWV